MTNWKQKIVLPDEVLVRLNPGMTVFISTGVAEPRTLVCHLMASERGNLQDLEKIQVVSIADAISLKTLDAQKFRLKTFFSGGLASEAITAGRVDLIPSRFAQIPRLIESGQYPIDAAFVQVTPPDDAGYCSLGVAVDVARQAIEQAHLVVGEINYKIPRTYGDTYISVAEFDYLIESTKPIPYFEPWKVDAIYDRVAANVASEIDNGSCLAFSIGPLFEALSRYLISKRQLGIHSPFFTDALMRLVRSGAVTNRFKTFYRSKSVASYALGSSELMRWLDRNPLVEFQTIDTVFNPIHIGKNPHFVATLPARKVDLSGRVALHFGKNMVAAGPGEAMDFISGAEISDGGKTLFALPSRNRKDQSNICLSVTKFEHQFGLAEAVDVVVTEYGVANLRGRSIRERAQALIDIAHPDDRLNLVQQAKTENMLYVDQIYLAECAHLFPADIKGQEIFKGELTLSFRAIKPSDEEGMRRLFYRFSDEAVYYRYFSPIKTMPHAKMQQYVNVDCNKVVSIVGIMDQSGTERIIAEARYIMDPKNRFAEVAFVVDENFHGLGIGTYMFKMLIRLGKERGLQGFAAEVLSSNQGMIKVFERGGLSIKAAFENGIYSLRMPFNNQ